MRQHVPRCAEDPRPPKAGAAALLTILLAAAAACGGEEEGAESEPLEEPAAAADTLEAAPVVAVASAPRELPPDAFPHGAHRDLECVTCHTTVPGHTRHLDANCVDCHEVPVSFAALRIPSERDCMTCHHLRQTGRECVQCHERSGLAGVRTVEIEIATSVRETDLVRDARFDHARHADAACSSCHSETAFAGVAMPCQSCHDDHHTAEADCGYCHTEVEATVHDDRTHRGCGGSGCHADAAVEALTPTRNLCLTCHAPQVDHEPDGDCADCHGIRVWGGRPVRGTA